MTEVVSDAVCNFFLNTTNVMHNGHEYTEVVPFRKFCHILFYGIFDKNGNVLRA